MSDLKVENIDAEKVSEHEDVASNEEAENDVKDVTNKKKKKKKRNKGKNKPEKYFFLRNLMHMLIRLE